jgi:hypothetical protein
VSGSDISKELMLVVAADPVNFYLAGGSALKQVLSITSHLWDTWNRDLSLRHKLCYAPAFMKVGVLFGLVARSVEVADAQLSVDLQFRSTPPPLVLIKCGHFLDISDWRFYDGHPFVALQ